MTQEFYTIMWIILICLIVFIPIIFLFFFIPLGSKAN